MVLLKQRRNKLFFPDNERQAPRGLAKNFAHSVN
jgi:hypothetical protein